MGSVNKVARNQKDEYAFKPYVLKQHITKNGLIPKGRSGHRITSDNSYLYSFGGYNPDLSSEERRINRDLPPAEMTLFKELWRFNIATGRWEKMAYYTPSLPKELASNAVLMSGNMLFVHGGTGVPFGQTSSNKTYVTNLKLDKKLKLLETKGNLPMQMYGHAMTLHGHYLYVVGGTSGYEYYSSIHRLDLKTNEWEELYLCKNVIGRHLKNGCRESEPEGRYRHEIAFYDSRIIVFGGGTASCVFDFQTLPAFNIVTRQWDLLTATPDPDHRPGFPAPRRCHGGVQLAEDEMQDPEFIICGGYDGGDIYSDIWKINLRTLQWTNCKEELLDPLYFHSTSLSPCGKMFVFGGICEVSDESDEVFDIRTNDIYSLWVKIPKLSEICWEAILHYNCDIVKYPKGKLLASGIPLEFVNRIL